MNGIMMEEKKPVKSGIVISKSKSYEVHKISLDKYVDKERTIKFNKGEKITVTKKELETIGEHRWLEVDAK